MSVLGEALDLLRRYGDVIGIDWDKGPGTVDGVVGSRSTVSDILNLAGSPIIAAAQLAIHGMKATTGSGEPQDGAAFKKSAELYEEAGNLLIDAAPAEDCWDGTAAQAYGSKNDEHRRLTLEVAEAEKAMGEALGRLAEQVRKTRTHLQETLEFLADYDTSTSWLNFIPGGAAIKAANDAAVASAQVANAQGSVVALAAESTLVANNMLALVGSYENAGAQKMLDSDPSNPYPCGEPFGDERTAGTLPMRAENDTSFIPPERSGPAVEYPPATPYGQPAPR